MITRLKTEIYLTIYGFSLLSLIMIWGGPELFSTRVDMKDEMRYTPEIDSTINIENLKVETPLNDEPKSANHKIIVDVKPPEPVVEVKTIENPLTIFSFIKEITSSLIAVGNVILLYRQINDKKKIVK